MLISVIVPTYKDDARLQLCVDALADQSLPKDKYEVIVVNNDTVDLSIDLPEPNFITLKETKPGSYSARNLGLSKASGSIIAFTDSDCIPDTDWLRCGLEAFEQSAAQRVAGSIQLFYKGASMTAVECYESIFAFDQETNVANGVSVTANLFVRRNVFDLVGTFDDSLLSGGDTEWNKRATQSGITLELQRSAVVLHPARSSWSELSKKLHRTIGGTFSQNPNYQISLFRTVFPPIEALQKITSSEGTFLTKLLAFLVAYRLKVARFFVLRSYRRSNTHPSRS